MKVSLPSQLAVWDRVSQALPDHGYWTTSGPDYRAVLVPVRGTENGLVSICRALGIAVIEVRTKNPYERVGFYPALPDRQFGSQDWQEWCPSKRCAVPEFIPDVSAGASAPTQLTPWKIKAIKIAIILEERPVTRGDFKALQIDPTRWMAPSFGWLLATQDGFVKGPSLPDFKGQHPRNYEEIRAKKAEWEKHLPRPLALVRDGELFNA